MRDYRIVSVDDHLVQPPTLWQDRLPSKYRDRGPRVVEGAGGDLELFLSRFSIKSGSSGDGHGRKFDSLLANFGDRPPGDAWVYDGEVFPTTGSSIVYRRALDDITTLLAFRYADLEPELYDPVARTRVMDEHGVIAAVCFPMSEFPRFCGQSFLEAKDKDLALACVQADGRQGNRSRKMAQESLFSEDRRSASAGQQGQDQKHYERDLFSRDQMGMDGEESNHERSAERETTESTGCSDAGRDHGISQGTARSTP